MSYSVFDGDGMTLSLDRKAYWLGDSVTVTLSTDRELRTELSRVELIRVVNYRSKGQKRVKKEVTTQEFNTKDEDVIASTDFLPESNPGRGRPHGYRATVQIPADADRKSVV